MSEDNKQTDREKALEALNRLTNRHGKLLYQELGAWVCVHIGTIRASLSPKTKPAIMDAIYDEIPTFQGSEYQDLNGADGALVANALHGFVEHLQALSPVSDGDNKREPVWLGHEIMGDHLFFGKMRQDGVKLDEIWYSVDMSGYTEEAKIMHISRAIILSNSQPTPPSHLCDKPELIEKLEAQKYTEDQGMDNEMEQFNAGLDAAIKAVGEA